MAFRPEYMAYLYGNRDRVEYELESDDSSNLSVNFESDSSDSSAETSEPPEAQQHHVMRRVSNYAANWYRFLNKDPGSYLGLLKVHKENPSGSARSEKFASRKEFDQFAWLLSTHRKFPKLSKTAEEKLSCIERGVKDDETKYRNLKQTANARVGVYRSKIHGRGLFSLVNIDTGEMVIELVGEVVRTVIMDKLHKCYKDKGLQSIFFKLDPYFVIDGTMKGNLSRFINHSCKPNCYPKVIEINGKRHLIIIAGSDINTLEEITCDYNLIFEDSQITCKCASRECRKVLNQLEGLQIVSNSATATEVVTGVNVAE